MIYTNIDIILNVKHNYFTIINVQNKSVEQILLLLKIR